MEKPLISIIFPSFNGEKVIRKNLISIKNLSNISDIEIVIIDNNQQAKKGNEPARHNRQAYLRPLQRLLESASPS